jgi:hypothetical protein
MWFVTNKKNTPILVLYNNLVINSFFNLLIELSKRPTIEIDLESHNFLQREFDSKVNLNSKLLKINKSSTDKIITLVKEIIRLGTNILEYQYNVYIAQNRYVNNNKYDIVEVEHPESIRKLFKDYFYDEFWSKSWIWTDIVGIDFNRAKFHSQFKIENRLTVCPYCDLDTITEQRNGWVEHFLPKGKFPYIACNPNNLLPSCTSCNVSGSGKGQNTKIPITTPFNEKIGNKINFNLIAGEIIIELSNENTIENYIELLNLRDRYKNPIVTNSILSILKDSYDLAVGLNKNEDFDNDLYVQYLENIGRKRGFYFAQRSLLIDIEEIRLMELN